MDEISEPSVTVVSGMVIEKSASIHSVNESQNNIGTLYPFLLLQTDQGEIIRINNLVADVYTDQQIAMGLKSTLYLTQIRHITNFKNMNIVLAAKSANGTGVLELPLRHVMSLYYMSIIIGIILGAAATFFASMPLIGLFDAVGIPLAFLVGLCVPIYFLWCSGKIAKARRVSLRLREKLLGGDGSGDTYHGVAVKNI
ncbi:hypothetical protein [Brucella pseudintermedia]|uniref:hypothetical protein n=1 Tax=Brucella pseudintermedia TaxID=370111 RepID=UPI0013CED3C4